MLKLRILTAFILIPFVLGLLFFAPFFVFEGVAAALMLLGAWEWAKLMGFEKLHERLWYLVFIAVLLFSVYYWDFVSETILVVGSMWWVFMTISLIYLVLQQREWRWPSWMVGVSGVLTLIPCWVALSTLRAIPQGDILIFMLLLCVWGADSGAYFSGRFFGRHKLAPLISPKKTWEGCYGGAFAIALIVAVYCLLEEKSFDGVLAWFGVGAAIWVASIVGDLFESLLKRGRSMKDSGQLLPGHGGILDRLDSLFAAAPIFALSILLFGEKLA